MRFSPVYLRSVLHRTSLSHSIEMGSCFSTGPFAEESKSHNSVGKSASALPQTSTTLTDRSPTAFYLGATGYVGGSVFVDLVRRYPQISWTALIRNTKGVTAVQAVGKNVRVVIGSHSDIALIEANAKTHDVTYNVADSDDLALIDAIIRGQETRAAGGGRKPIFIHTRYVRPDFFVIALADVSAKVVPA